MRNHQTTSVQNGFVKKRNQSSSFVKAILDCIVNGFSCIGDNIAQVILFYMNTNCDLKAEEIPNKPRKFVESLEKLFGDGSRLILNKVNYEVARKFQIEYKKDMRFEDLIEATAARTLPHGGWYLC